MDPIQLQRLKGILGEAQEAMEQGMTEEEIDQAISADATIPYPNLFALRNAVESAEEGIVAAAAGRAGERSALSNAGRMAAQGATFGFADELIGLFGGDAEASRQRVEDLRTAEPVASAVSDIAGGLLFPAGAVRGGGRVAANVLGRGGRTTRAASRGIFAGTVGGGAIEGAVSGAGEAEGGILERLPEMGVGAGIGAATGGLLAGGGSVFNRLRGRGPRLRSALGEATRFDGQINPAIQRADERIQIVRRGFQELDEEFPTVDSPEINAYLQDLLSDRDTKSAVRAASKELAQGGRLPSFSDLQDIRQRLRQKGLRDEADVLSDLMEDEFGETFTRTNRRYRLALREREAIDEGIKAWDWGAERAERRIREINADAGAGAVRRFQQGRVSEVMRRLGRREKGSLKPINDFLEAGGPMRDQIRTLFMVGDGQVDEAAFQAFDRAIRQEKDVDLAWKIVKGLGAAGAVAAGGLRLFNTTQGNQ